MGQIMALDWSILCSISVCQSVYRDFYYYSQWDSHIRTKSINNGESKIWLIGVSTLVFGLIFRLMSFFFSNAKLTTLAHHIKYYPYIHFTIQNFLFIIKKPKKINQSKKEVKKKNSGKAAHDREPTRRPFLPLTRGTCHERLASSLSSLS